MVYVIQRTIRLLKSSGMWYTDDLLCCLQIEDATCLIFYVLRSLLPLCSFSSPLNEDVFTLPRVLEESTLTPDIAQISEQIHRLLVQPVHSSSSQGYGSLASNGSHELQPSAASSSESNGTALEDPAQLHKPVSTIVTQLLVLLIVQLLSAFKVRSQSGCKHRYTQCSIWDFVLKSTNFGPACL